MSDYFTTFSIEHPEPEPEKAEAKTVVATLLTPIPTSTANYAQKWASACFGLLIATGFVSAAVSVLLIFVLPVVGLLPAAVVGGLALFTMLTLALMGAAFAWFALLKDRELGKEQK